MRYSQIIFIAFSLLLSACSKSETEKPTILEKKKLIDIYLEVTNPELDASISLTNYQANFGKSSEDIVNYMTTVCPEGKGICSYDKLHVNEEKFDFLQGRQTLQNGYDFNAFFGRQLQFSIKGDRQEKDNYQIANMYLPEALQVTFQDDTFLGAGHMIYWNEDVQNEQGVFIVALYHPLENSSISELYPNKLTNYIELEDDGSYVFSPTDFPDIPEGSIVTLKIMRGAYVISETQIGEEQLVRVLGLTHSTGYIKFN